MIRATGIAKHFGAKRALGPVSFEVGRGEAVGFLGLNGAGKTTALRILAGDLRPSAGTLEIDGVDAIRDPLAVRRLVGFLPEHPPLYPEMAVSDYLRFAGRLRGMDAAATERRLAEVEDMLGLGPVRRELTRNLSEGYRQRVGLAQAVIHEPALLVLDEPAHDLDPAQIVEMRALLGRLGERHTILLSSHNLPEISETCDRLLVLDQGTIIASGTEAELASRWRDRQRIEIEVRLGATGGAGAGAEAVRGAVAALERVDGVSAVEASVADVGTAVLLVESSQDRRAEACRALVEGGWDVVRLERSRQKLESMFLALVGGSDRGAHRDHPAA